MSRCNTFYGKGIAFTSDRESGDARKRRDAEPERGAEAVIFDIAPLILARGLGAAPWLRLQPASTLAGEVAQAAMQAGER